MAEIDIMISNLGHYDRDIANTAKKDLLLQRTKAIPYLIDALTNPDQVIVAEIAHLLGLYRKDAITAVDALVTISYMNNSRIRANAIASIGLIAEKAEGCIPVLTHYIKDKDVNVRRYAVAALGVFDHAASYAVHELVDALEDEDAIVREFAASILNELGSVPAPLVKQIVRTLRDADPFVRSPIINLLGKIRKNTGHTIAELIFSSDSAYGHMSYRAGSENNIKMTVVV